MRADPLAPVVFVPGGMNPAVVTYAELIPFLSYEIDPLLKDHELYRGDAPPAGWTLDTEVDAILAAADRRGFGTFHVVGYSGGGGITMKLVERAPERLRSVALVEPAWVGERGPKELALLPEIRRSTTLPPDQFFSAFTRALVKPEAKLAPPAGPAPSWMRKRPAGFGAFIREFDRARLDRARLAAFDRPAYVAYGDLSHEFEEEKAKTVGRTFPRATVEMYAGTHHFDPPHRQQPERFADALRKLWASA